jgi:hypothetical protein
MAHRLFMIRKLREKERDKRMKEMMTENVGRGTGEKAITSELGGFYDYESSSSRKLRVTGKGSGECLGGMGIGSLGKKKPKEHFNDNSLGTHFDQHKLGLQQNEGWEHNFPLVHQNSLSTSLLAEGTNDTNDILFAALALQQAARGGTLMEDSTEGSVAAKEKHKKDFIQNSGYRKVSHSTLVPPPSPHRALMGAIASMHRLPAGF